MATLIPGELAKYVHNDSYGVSLLNLLYERRQHQIEKTAWSLDPFDKGGVTLLDELINAFEPLPQINDEDYQNGDTISTSSTHLYIETSTNDDYGFESTYHSIHEPDFEYYWHHQVEALKVNIYYWDGNDWVFYKTETHQWTHDDNDNELPGNINWNFELILDAVSEDTVYKIEVDTLNGYGPAHGETDRWLSEVSNAPHSLFVLYIEIDTTSPEAVEFLATDGEESDNDGTIETREQIEIRITAQDTTLPLIPEVQCPEHEVVDSYLMLWHDDDVF